MKSKIEWTQVTWNPVTGCTKISDGCKNCYAEAFSYRLQGMGVEKYKDGFKVRLHPDTINDPFKWKKSRVVFVNSMGDLFHNEVPESFIVKVFNVMKDNPQHIFQVLTKRAERLEELNNRGILDWADNIWMGVTVENEEVLNRIDNLTKTGAKIKFLSCEPLLGSLKNMNLEGINWVITGGESGRNSRPMEKEWVEEIRENCIKTETAFFFKQWGGFNKKKNGRILDGKIWEQMPSLDEIAV